MVEEDIKYVKKKLVPEGWLVKEKIDNKHLVAGHFTPAATYLLGHSVSLIISKIHLADLFVRYYSQGDGIQA